MAFARADPVRQHLRAALAALYGDRQDRAVLYGSRPRGDVHAESGYDVAVFLRDMPDRWAEVRRLGDLSTDRLDRTGELVHAMPFFAGARRPGSRPWRARKLTGCWGS